MAEITNFHLLSLKLSIPIADSVRMAGDTYNIHECIITDMFQGILTLFKAGTDK